MKVGQAIKMRLIETNFNISEMENLFPPTIWLNVNRAQTVVGLPSFLWSKLFVKVVTSNKVQTMFVKGLDADNLKVYFQL